MHWEKAIKVPEWITFNIVFNSVREIHKIYFSLYPNQQLNYRKISQEGGNPEVVKWSFCG